MDDRVKRLIDLKETVKGYFEVTGVGVGGWEAGFDAVRHTDALAESFVTDLRRLVMFIESEFEFADETRKDTLLPEARPSNPRPPKTPLAPSSGAGRPVGAGSAAPSASRPAAATSAPRPASPARLSAPPAASARAAVRGVPVPPPRVAPSAKPGQPLASPGHEGAPASSRPASEGAAPSSRSGGGTASVPGRGSPGHGSTSSGKTGATAPRGEHGGPASRRGERAEPAAVPPSDLVEVTAQQALEEFTADPTEKVVLPEKRGFSPSGRHRRR